LWTYGQYPFGALRHKDAARPESGFRYPEPTSASTNRRNSPIMVRTAVQVRFFGGKPPDPDQFVRPEFRTIGSKDPTTMPPAEHHRRRRQRRRINFHRVLPASQSPPGRAFPVSKTFRKSAAFRGVASVDSAIPLGLRQPLEVLGESSERFRRGRQVLRELLDHGP